jgi:hypothetical protein
VQRTSPNTISGNVYRAVDRLTRRTVNRLTPTTAGSWYGNDTAWRMALDIARILIYGTNSGTLESAPQRRHVILVDGVVAGEEEGPLSPKAVKCGTLLFSDDVVSADWTVSRLMGFDPQKLALLRETLKLSPHPITKINPLSQDVFFNGRHESLERVLATHSRAFQPPVGWRGHIEFESTSELRAETA